MNLKAAIDTTTTFESEFKYAWQNTLRCDTNQPGENPFWEIGTKFHPGDCITHTYVS